MAHPQHSTTSFRRRVTGTITRIIDPARVEHVMLTSVAAGALALADPARRGPGGRLALRSASAALSAFVVWADFRRTRRPGETASAAALSVGATFGFAEVGDAIDARMQHALVRTGARHPRLVLALGGVCLMAVAQVAAMKMDAASAPPRAFDDLEDEAPIDLPQPVRDIVAALLSHADSWGRTELLDQLAGARAIPYIGEDETAFYPGIGFDVPDDLPRAVPGDARFPIIGRYHPFEGRSADVSLSVWGGKLAHLTIAPGDDWTDEDHEAWGEAGGSVQSLEGWPSPHELTLLVETPSGLRPIL